MHRKISYRLEEHFKAGYPFPIIIAGMRGTGKTTSALLFAEQNYAERVYLCFENDPGLRTFFEEHSDMELPEAVSSFLASEAILPVNVICILDEICYSAAAYDMFLRYTRSILSEGEQRRTCCGFLAISSIYPGMLSAEEEKQIVFRLAPLSFDEYLDVCGHSWYTDIIRAHLHEMKKIPDMVHGEITDLYNSFLETGGMPAAVAAQLDGPAGSIAAEEIRAGIMDHLRQSAMRFYDDQLVNGILDAIPECIRGNGRRFKFTSVRKGLTYKLCKNSVNDLCNMMITVRIMTGDDSDGSSFVLIPADQGILGTILKSKGLSPEEIHPIINLSSVMLTLFSNGHQIKYYDSRSLISDFVSKDDELICIKHDNARKSKIGKVTDSNGEGLSMGYILTPDNFEMINETKHIPYYAAFCL